jgi:rare lipoprotein A
MLRAIRNIVGFGVRERLKTLAGSTVICLMATIVASDAQARIRGAAHSFASERYETPDREDDSEAVGGRPLQSGLASWYGPGFHGRRTASGERFDQNDMTAAHRSLPFGTRVRVVNQTTGRSVVVRINDRGPHVRGRIIDLSRGSARMLGIGGAARVRVVSLN